MEEHLEQLRNLDATEVKRVAKRWGTPVFVYDEQHLKQQAAQALSFPAPYGLTVRYAMKANPNRHILDVFRGFDIGIDASSGFEAERAMLAGYEGGDILLTSQELPDNLGELVEKGVEFNACSLRQLDAYGRLFPGSAISLRINPGLGSGHSEKTNVGGPASSFGIWHEYIPQAQALAKKHRLKVKRLHTHIGSGNDPAVWERVALLSLEQVEKFAAVEVLNLGGGFKVGRMKDEVTADLAVIGAPIAAALEQFQAKTGRKLHLEIEPGGLLVANAGSLITTIHDIVDTGEEGFVFLKTDGGMTEILRPALYGAQHPLVVVGRQGQAREHQKYVVVGHCCESGDLLTPYPNDPEAILPRLLAKAAVGDFLVVEGAGAYCAYMSAQNYNSFPLRPEVMKRADGSLVEICRQESLAEMLKLEGEPSIDK